MKTLIFGRNGQVAWELQRSLAVHGEVRAVGSEEVSFLSLDSISKVIREYKPNHIVNAAAYTAVDRAENEKDIADKVNGEAVGVIAAEAKRIGASFMHYSTDYVFDGTKSEPYVESDQVCPINAYGRSKVLGEKLIQEVGSDFTILRIGWVYGARGNNFYRTMLRLGAEKSELAIVADQIGSPTWSRHVADASAHILFDRQRKDKAGIYHLSPQGEVSWFDFACKIFELTRTLHPSRSLKIQTIKKIETEDYITPALRPLNSRMNANKVNSTFGIQLPHWEKSLRLVTADVPL
ncbi:dTDP-4-dehydrorhamnose reductase [Bdellovibrio sp. 22V]|uniref:dTDP-4-dehydrorhamnose reductase n=1 Tax=Bdellovibrio sp. 22V TaxID=3044166 RepID=UPI0025439B38|nr:dTDP-4-dehydrorhamnose reductase [Bdellovibrio sp. 22V]WII71840.1 dTDP-4-dehydrorhamnose reductase [Bdellovibrio sp. 22V]